MRIYGEGDGQREGRSGLKGLTDEMTKRAAEGIECVGISGGCPEVTA